MTATSAETDTPISAGAAKPGDNKAPISLQPRQAAPASTESTAKIALAAFAPDTWPSVYAALAIEGLLQTTVAHCILSGKQANTWVFILDEHHSALYDSSHQQRLAALLTDYFDEVLKVRIDIAKIDAALETPAAYTARCQRQRLQQAETAIADDPLVHQLIRQFDAQVVEGSIAPVAH